MPLPAHVLRMVRYDEYRWKSGIPTSPRRVPCLELGGVRSAGRGSGVLPRVVDDLGKYTREPRSRSISEGVFSQVLGIV